MLWCAPLMSIFRIKRKFNNWQHISVDTCVNIWNLFKKIQIYMINNNTQKYKKKLKILFKPKPRNQQKINICQLLTVLLVWFLTYLHNTHDDLTGCVNVYV